MIKKTHVTILFILFFLLYSSGTAFTQNCFTDKRSSVKICFPTDQSIFPNSWCTEQINGQYIPLEKKEFERSKEIILICLEKYPADVLEKNLDIIYIVNSLRFYNQGFGGTNSNKNVYMSNKGIDKGYDAFYLEQLFHAEFSSILLRNYPEYFDKNAWKEFNSPNFKYGTGGVNALKNNQNSEKLDSEINELGLLNQYAMSDIENDFNSFAKNIFHPKNHFEEVIKKHTGLTGKRTLIIAFYNSIDPFFTEEFFNDLMKTE